MTRKRVRGHVAWSPSAETKVTLGQIIAVLEEYREFWPLTIRQVFYRLVGRYDFAKTEKDYSRLGEYINRGRREYRDVPWNLPWEAFRDDGVTSATHHGFKDAAGFIETVCYSASKFRLDLMARQAVHLEVVCETAGMVPQLERVADRYGVGVSSSGGFDSTTRKHELAVRLSNIGRPCILLHIGDFDPSGVHMCSSLDEDLSAFCAVYGGNLSMDRLAVTPEQQEQYDLPTAPPKPTDNRSFDANFTVQAEALDPGDLATIVDAGIRSFINMDIHAKALRAEKQIRGKLIKRMQKA